jgi:hypothetical protein
MHEPMCKTHTAAATHDHRRALFCFRLPGLYDAHHQKDNDDHEK